MKYIDLGLSVLWADCNLGTNTPEEFSNYYDWNDIPKGYEIPTIEQYKELIENCNCTWTNQNGINGYKVTSKKNGNSIFLPAAGHRYYNNAYGKDNYGFYWASSLNMNYKNSAYYLYFSSVQVDYGSNYYHMGFSVRAIKSKTNFKNKTTMTLKEVNEIFPLKSGMCLELEKDNKVERIILFQYRDGSICYVRYDASNTWDLAIHIMNNNYHVIKVYNSPNKSAVIFGEEDKIFDSNNYIIKELTLQEIADKFGVKPENLRIKK